MVSPWPFAVWGIDIIGTLPLAKGGAKYAIVAVDYFTKWAEAEPLATITTKKVINFIVRNNICRFGLPHSIITDNGAQFDSAEFKNFCQRFHIHKKFSAVAHPQANGQVEAVNKVIKSILKKRLEKAGGKWVDEFLWRYGPIERLIKLQPVIPRFLYLMVLKQLFRSKWKYILIM